MGRHKLACPQKSSSTVLRKQKIACSFQHLRAGFQVATFCTVKGGWYPPGLGLLNSSYNFAVPISL